MKVGYSNFTGEIVKAEDLEHGDCSEFQVVCPCCREPVFKVVRQSPSGPIHFLSHYPGTAADVEVCENRVAGSSSPLLFPVGRTAKHQFMQAFDKVLIEELNPGEMIGPQAAAFHSLYMRSEAIKELMPLLIQDMLSDVPEERLVSNVAYSASLRPRWMGRGNTNFEIELSRQISLDVMKMLASGKAMRALRHIICFGAAWAKCAMIAGNSKFKPLVSFMDLIRDKSVTKALKLVQRELGKPRVDGYTTIDLLLFGMVGVLVQLDYIEIINRRFRDLDNDLARQVLERANLDRQGSTLQEVR